MRWVLRYQPRISGIMSSVLYLPSWLLTIAAVQQKATCRLVEKVNKISRRPSLSPLPIHKSLTIILENTMNIY